MAIHNAGEKYEAVSVCPVTDISPALTVKKSIYTIAI